MLAIPTPRLRPADWSISFDEEQSATLKEWCPLPMESSSTAFQGGRLAKVSGQMLVIHPARRVVTCTICPVTPLEKIPRHRDKRGWFQSGSIEAFPTRAIAAARGNPCWAARASAASASAAAGSSGLFILAVARALSGGFGNIAHNTLPFRRSVGSVFVADWAGQFDALTNERPQQADDNFRNDYRVAIARGLQFGPQDLSHRRHSG